MALIVQITDELKAAMKSGDTGKRDTLRLLQSAVKNAAIEMRKGALTMTDSEVQDVVKKLVKQRKDSIEQYQAGGRADLATKEQAELDLLALYLPAMLSREDTEKIVDTVLARLGDVTAKDMGRVMGAVMQEGKGMVDGGVVREIVATRLK